MLTIVMYHYVRDLARSRYPALKALDLEKFNGQLDYIDKNHTVVSLAQVLAAADGGAPLARNACVLSFDDGFLDHYTNVFPRLKRRGWPGCFFPPARAVLENKVLDVHKIHIILASTVDPEKLVTRIFECLSPFRQDFDIPADAELYAQAAKPSRYDPPEIVFVKKILQRDLPEFVRERIVDELFADCVADEAAFAKDYYMDLEQMRRMSLSGMEFGGHGYRHVWLGSLTAEEQRDEIRRTMDFLNLINGAPVRDWAMCYPYGSYNPTTLTLLREVNCRIGLSTEVDEVKNLTNLLELPRLNTNDIPCSGSSPPPVRVSA
jgi:peptidoglycan/xylan/chitin deacetylase (PgdA/CDA1 family)